MSQYCGTIQMRNTSCREGLLFQFCISIFLMNEFLNIFTLTGHFGWWILPIYFFFNLVWFIFFFALLKQLLAWSTICATAMSNRQSAGSLMAPPYSPDVHEVHKEPMCPTSALQTEKNHKVHLKQYIKLTDCHLRWRNYYTLMFSKGLVLTCSK